MASNTAVAQSTLTHPMRMLIPATCACSFAFVLPVATPPKAMVFGTNRIKIADFLKAGLVRNFVAVLLGIHIFLWNGKRRVSKIHPQNMRPLIQTRQHLPIRHDVQTEASHR